MKRAGPLARQSTPQPAVLTGALAIPLGDPHHYVNVRELQKTLTARYTPMGEMPVEVECFAIDNNYLYAPRQWGIAYCRQHGIPIEDRTAQGRAVAFSALNPPRDYQIGFIDDLIGTTETHYDFLAQAFTGFGKTYCGLATAARLGTTTLIIVDQDNLKDQWLDALRLHFGMTIENGEVGTIQGKICDYQRPVVIAMVQTLSQKVFPQEVYDYFGLVLVDECHTIGAPTFSIVLRQFPATYRIGLSATPRRKDGLQKLLDYNLGKVRVATSKQHDESAVYFASHPTVYSWYANISPKIGRILTEVAEDGSRNLLIAESALYLYQTGRDVIVLGDRIGQLQDIISLLYYMGVEPGVAGLYAGGEPHWRWAKNPTPARRPTGLVKHRDSGQAEYTPVSLQLITKKIPKKRLMEVKSSAKIFCGTYGMCAKGFDEPRLCAGIDATPRGAAEQIHGRILRKVKGKKTPIWVTIVDENNYRLVYSFGNRIADYAKSNARIFKWNRKHDTQEGTDGELTECHAKKLQKQAQARKVSLQSMSIETASNGLNMLVTKASVMAQKRRQEIDTAKSRIRAVRAPPG